MGIATEKTFQGFACKEKGKPLVPYQFQPEALGPWDIEVEISHCGICHSDIHLIDNDWGNTSYPLVPGHEIIGTVKAKGENVARFEVGQRVGIGWQRSSCHQCESCHRGEENNCLTHEATCVGHFGGFADKIVADSRFAFQIPDSLASENAAPLLCGGATVFSPLLEHQVAAPMRIGVIGIGGLGHLALQFTRAFGCHVTAFSSTPAKEKEAKDFGAHLFLPSNDPKALASAANSFDLLLCTTSHAIDWESCVNMLRPKGKLILLTAIQDKVAVPIMQLIIGRRQIAGSNIGSPLDIEKMLSFAEREGIIAQTELFPMSEVNRAIEKLVANQIHYRAVLEA